MRVILLVILFCIIAIKLLSAYEKELESILGVQGGILGLVLGTICCVLAVVIDLAIKFTEDS